MLLAACSVQMTEAQAASPSERGPQLIPRSEEQREQNFRAEHHAILNVEVTDEHGNRVMDLKPEDFTLLDNGQPRAVASFQVVEHAVPPAMPRVVLVLDVLNQSPHEIGRDVAAVRKYLMRAHGELATPTAIGVMSSSGLKIGQVSQNRLAVFQQLGTMANGVKATGCGNRGDGSMLYSEIYANRTSMTTVPKQAANCLNDRFIASVHGLEQQSLNEENTMGRLILIWIGRGWPQLRGRQFTPDSPELKENYFEHVVSISTAMLDGWVTLDWVAARGTVDFPEKQFRADGRDGPLAAGVANEKEATAQSLSLPTLARQSGGQVLDEADDLAAAIAQCVEDRESYYQLSFDFPASAAANEYHPIEVKVNRLGMVVRTSTMYYAQP